MRQEEEKPRSTTGKKDESQRETSESSPPFGTPGETMAKQFADVLSSSERAQLETYWKSEQLKAVRESQQEQKLEAGRSGTFDSLSAAGVSPVSGAGEQKRHVQGEAQRGTQEAGISMRAQEMRQGAKPTSRAQTPWKTFAMVLALLVLVFGGVLISTTVLLPRGQHATQGATTVPPTEDRATPAGGTTLSTYRGHSNSVNAVAWSPDGKRIASGSWDKTVQVWDAVSGTNVTTYRGHAENVEALAWSPDGRRIASAGDDDEMVQVWDAASGGNVYTYHGDSYHASAPIHATAPAWTLAWSPDGRRIASAGNDYTVQVWDAADGGNVSTYWGHSNDVKAVAWSPDGKRIASASADKTVQVWDADTLANVLTYRGHAGEGVVALAWSPDGKRIASSSWDKTVQVWDADTGGNVTTYRGHADTVEALAWSPSGKRIASASKDRTVQVWDAVTFGNVSTYRGHSNDVSAVAWSPDGKLLASAGGDTVQVWQAP